MEQKKSIWSFLWTVVLLPIIEKHGPEFIDWLIEKLQAHKEDNAVHTDGTDCPQPAPTNKPTPYGKWVCLNRSWQWQPEIG